MTAAVADTASVEIALAEEAARVVDRMTDGLGLWTDRAEAALFLASVAAARNEAPIPEDELSDDRTTVGTLSDVASEGDEDHLALFAIVEDPETDPIDVLDENLTGWIEAGAEIVGPRLDGRALDATRQIRELVAEIE